MGDEQDLWLDHDDKYGELIDFTLIDQFNPGQPVFVGIIRHREQDYLFAARMYIKGDQLKWGKAQIRLALEEEEAETVCLAMQAFVASYGLNEG